MKDFFKGVGNEFRKVTWPTDKEMRDYTIQVFIFIFVLAVFFAGVDFVISQIMHRL